MKRIKSFFGITAWLVAVLLLASACNDDMDIHKVYAFDLATMPVQKEIAKGEGGCCYQTIFTRWIKKRSGCTTLRYVPTNK